jgi:hypothetical protein
MLRRKGRERQGRVGRGRGREVEARVGKEEVFAHLEVV